MTDLTLSERIRVRAALCDTVDLSLSREQALAIVKMMEREADLADSLQYLIAQANELDRKTNARLIRMGIDLSVFYASSLWIIWFLS